SLLKQSRIQYASGQAPCGERQIEREFLLAVIKPGLTNRYSAKRRQIQTQVIKVMRVYIADKFAEHFVVRTRSSFQQAHRHAMPGQMNCRRRSCWPAADDDRLVAHQTAAALLPTALLLDVLLYDVLLHDTHKRNGKNHCTRTLLASPA